MRLLHGNFADSSVDNLNDVWVQNQFLLDIKHIVEAKISDVGLVSCDLSHHVRGEILASAQFFDRLCKIDAASSIWELGVFSTEKICQEVFNALDCEEEVLVLWGSQNVVREASERNDKFTDKSSNNDHSVISGIWISDIIYLGLWSVLFKDSWNYNLLLDLFLEVFESLLLPKCSSSLLSLPPLILFLSLLSHFFFLSLLALVELLYNGLLVEDGNGTHRLVEHLVHLILVIMVLLHIELDLVVELGNEGGTS